MKNRLIAAALAAFFMLPFAGLAAYADELDAADMTEIEVIAEETDTDEAQDTPETEETVAVDPTPTSLPPGTGTVIDYDTDPDGRLFYTIMTPDEHVFYLVIDKNRNMDNVYFLNAVTIADLVALAEIPLPAQGGVYEPKPTATEQPPAEPDPIEEEPQSGGNTGMYIFIIVIAVLGGGAGWYFKIYRPKQQGTVSGDEYDPSMNDAENDYSDDWGDDADDSDDAPPWDDDVESGDEE